MQLCRECGALEQGTKEVIDAFGVSFEVCANCGAEADLYVEEINEDDEDR